MFEIRWTEFLVVGILALVLFRPSDLPEAMRTLGRLAAKIKRTIHEMQDQFRTAMHEADLQDIHKAIEDVGDLRSLSPGKQISKALGDTLGSTLDDVKTELERDNKPQPPEKPHDV
jgi:sec-independent protein translocase protein TatB